MVGVNNPGSAPRKLRQRSAAEAGSGLRMLRHLIRTTMTIKTRRISPGITPAAKVCETGTLVRALNNIAAFEGGIRASRSAAEAARTMTKGLGYPCSSIFGIMIVPTAVMAARMEPQKAAKNPMAITMAMPRPPGQWPTSAVAKSTRRLAAPPRSITIPAKMNKGTATRMCFVIAPKET